MISEFNREIKIKKNKSKSDNKKKVPPEELQRIINNKSKKTVPFITTCGSCHSL